MSRNILSGTRLIPKWKNRGFWDTRLLSPISNESCIGYWDLVSGVGNDKSNKGNNIIITGALPSQLGYYFDGVNDFGQGTRNLGLSGDATFTLEAWAKPTGVLGHVFYVGDIGADFSAISLSLDISAQGQLSCGFFGYSADTAVSQFTNDVWHHFVVTKTPGNILTTTKFYIDGVESANDSTEEGTPNIVDGTPLLARYFIGEYGRVTIGIVRVYKNSLSPTKILSNFNIERVIFGV
jgi:hypothetical protein